MKGPSSSGVQTLGKWVVWNGNEKKGFVCQFKKKGKVENVTFFLLLALGFRMQEWLDGRHRAQQVSEGLHGGQQYDDLDKCSEEMRGAGSQWQLGIFACGK